MDKRAENIDIELIARYLSGEITADQKAGLEAWIDASEENKKQFEDYRKVWMEVDKIRSIAGLDLDAEWDSLSSKMAASGRGISMQSPRAKSASSPRSSVFYISRFAAAAVLLMALVFGGIWISRQTGHETMATSDQPAEIVLPDGSSVTLNVHSSLRYPRRFSGENRQVGMEGEAFFEVVRDSLRPFVIKTPEVDVKVLGTSFNVNAYKENERVEVTVKSGKVAVTRPGKVPSTIIVNPGKQAVFNKKEETLGFSASVNPNYLSWRTRSFIFEDQTLQHVVMELNKVYGTDIRIPSDSLRAARITTRFDDQSLDAILNVLAATFDLEIRETENKLLLVESN